MAFTVVTGAARDAVPVTRAVPAEMGFIFRVDRGSDAPLSKF